MSPLRSQHLLRGSCTPPLIRATAPKASDYRSLGRPHDLTTSNKASEVFPGPSSSPPSNLVLYDGYTSFQLNSHAERAPEVSMTPNPHPAMFGPNSKFLVNGGHLSFQQHTHVHQASNAGGIQFLYQNASSGAAYNSKDRYDPPKCHPNTRTGLLNTTQDWAQNGRFRIMWLYGSAGAGKSAVAQTMAQEFRAGSNLAASFFFSRTAPPNSHRGHEGCFVTTIAYQLTEVVPGLQRYVEQVILSRPSVFDLTLTEQVRALIIDPLKELQLDMASHGNTSCMLPKVIIVDGLDECKEERGQVQVLEAIATLVSHQDVFPCLVFIASRPELAIRSWMATKQLNNSQLVKSMSLLDHCDSDHDIEVFVKDEATGIQQSHPLKYLLPPGWPPSEFVKEIVKRACGQFIYASTIMKYIKDLRGNPSDRLRAILLHTTPIHDRPYAELDTLYLHILRQTQHPHLVHQILAFRVVTATFWGSIYGVDTRSYLQTLLSLPCSVHEILIDLQSIMSCDVDGMKFIDNPSPPSSFPSSFHHASLMEFLIDPHRSEEFYIDLHRFDKELCELAIKQIRDSYSDGMDRGYVIYCFLILLQTRTSCCVPYRDQVIAQLSSWDALHDKMLFSILDRLRDKSTGQAKVNMVDIIDRHLWSAFAPAVSRMRAQLYQEFENAGLPLELFVMSMPGVNILQTTLPYRDLPIDAGLHDLFAWHVNTCIQQSTGNDPWHFVNLSSASDKGHHFLQNHYWESKWHEYVDVLDYYLPDAEKQALQIENVQQNALSEWETLAPSVAIFSIKHVISLFDPLEEASKPWPIEVRVVFDRLSKKLGQNWRSTAAAILLENIGRFIWTSCPISTDIISALEEISRRLFPPDVVSIMEDAAFAFDFLSPDSESQRQLLRSSSSPCALPRWFHAPSDCIGLHGYGAEGRKVRRSLGLLHDYARLYEICNNIGSNPIDADDAGEELDDVSDLESLDTGCNDFSDPLGFGACELVEETRDPKTGRLIDWETWSLWKRSTRFIDHYEEMEDNHEQMVVDEQASD